VKKDVENEMVVMAVKKRTSVCLYGNEHVHFSCGCEGAMMVVVVVMMKRCSQHGHESEEQNGIAKNTSEFLLNNHSIYI
jgi:hypothetical protein